MLLIFSPLSASSPFTLAKDGKDGAARNKKNAGSSDKEN
jgi:hypothetical protein